MLSRRGRPTHVRQSVLPVYVGSTATSFAGYRWPGLRVASSQQGVMSGRGVFAAIPLTAGARVALLGLPIRTQYELEKLKDRHLDTHLVYIANQGWIDGHPRLRPFDNIGGAGLFIAMMVNEPSGKKKPNCIFEGRYLVIGENIAPGEELTVSYGPVYRRVDYKVSPSSMRKCRYPKLDKFKHSR